MIQTKFKLKSRGGGGTLMASAAVTRGEPEPARAGRPGGDGSEAAPAASEAVRLAASRLMATARGPEPPFSAVKRPARPHKSPVQIGFA